jgi:P pilus assembly chaperone PapD
MKINNFAVGLFIPIIFSSYAHAGVVMGGTRIIYPQGNRDVAFSVTNLDKNTPYLIQSWIENFDASNRGAVPFVVTPPLFRLDPEQKNVLRISYLGMPLVSDRESIFWLNVKNISPSHKDGNNKLQINVKSKFKIFFRPSTISGNPNLAYKQLKFSCDDNKLTVHNPTPYFVSFYSIETGSSHIKEPGMVFPLADKSWSATCNGMIRWRAINDFGGITRIASMS